MKQINREWKFIFKDDKFFPVSWKELLKISGVRDGINENVYNFLSWHSHSQSISILQLQDMWNDNFDQVSLRISVDKLNMFIGFMVSDIVVAEKEFRDVYDKLDEDLRELINFYNLSYRGENFTIK